MLEYACDFCGATFKRKSSESKGQHHFCNHTCYAKWRIGRKREGYSYKHSQEWKDELGKRMKGNKYRLGIRHTEEDKIKMSKAVRKNLDINPETHRKLREATKGENNPNWKGGSSKIEFEKAFELSLSQWDKLSFKIRKRDNHICQYCGKLDSYVVHHIIPRRIKIDNHPDNLITLCKNCHPKVECLTNTHIEQNKNPIEIFYEAWS